MQLEHVKDKKSINANEIYKFWENKVCNMIKQSKKQQYSEMMNENAKNPASTWKLFKEIGASKRKTVQILIP